MGSISFSHRHFILPPLLLLVWTLPGWSLAGGLSYLNQLRSQAGMTTLQQQPALARAAANHAAYLANNHWSDGGQPLHSAHAELPDGNYFTGEKVAQRVQHAGYPHDVVLENVSQGDAEMDVYAAIDGLMSAIYHRFTFLDFTVDEIGIAGENGVQVFELGRSDLRGLCTSPDSEALFTPPVYCLDTLVSGSYHDNLCQQIPSRALYKEPWHEACANHARLDAGYMRRFCQQPPAAALLQGPGRYYTLCDGRRKVRKGWFDQLCASPPAEARYPHSGRYYTICDSKARVNENWYRDICASTPEFGRYRESASYQLFCSHNPLQVRPEYLQQRLLEMRRRNPALVVWPADGATDIPPAFFEEDPDPLPDFSVSGYPLSIQVNPATWEKASVVSFMLYRKSGDEWASVDILPPMSKNNDPNDRFTVHQFALFPVRRLQWNSHYRAVAELQLDNERRRVEWSFATRDPGGEMIDLSAKNRRRTLHVNTDYVLYWPVSHGGHRPATSQVSTRFPQGIEMQLKVIDPDTVELRVEASRCGRVGVEFSRDRKADFQLTGCR
ncbi:MAG: CAP domain-containing protein [Pseudomonadota bacterium]